MSPLARSLLALAALLATAASGSDNCKHNLFGSETSFPVPMDPVSLDPPGGLLDIKDPCQTHRRPASIRLGAQVTVCNHDKSGSIPIVYKDPDYQLEWMRVVCPDGCPRGVTAYITVYCSM